MPSPAPPWRIMVNALISQENRPAQPVHNLYTGGCGGFRGGEGLTGRAVGGEGLGGKRSFAAGRLYVCNGNDGCGRQAEFDIPARNMPLGAGRYLGSVSRSTSLCSFRKDRHAAWTVCRSI